MTTRFSPEKKLRILIVDDININCELLELLLDDIAVLEIANTGEDAVLKTLCNNYDLVLLDICLGPGMDGLEVLSEIRSQPGNISLPIIAVTGSATEFEREDFLEKGFSEFVSKPVSKKELLFTIEKVLDSHA